MPPTKPLFASNRRDSSIHSEERAADEDTALLGSQGKIPSNSRSTYAFWRELGLFVWAIIATAAVIVLAAVSQHQAAQHHDKKPAAVGKRNLIFMVSDGMGPASLSMTRSFRQFKGMFKLCRIWNVVDHCRWPTSRRCPYYRSTFHWILANEIEQFASHRLCSWSDCLFLRNEELQWSH